LEGLLFRRYGGIEFVIIEVWRLPIDGLVKRSTSWNRALEGLLFRRYRGIEEIISIEASIKSIKE
jgi:hypothetical protein